MSEFCEKISKLSSKGTKRKRGPVKIQFNFRIVTSKTSRNLSQIAASFYIFHHLFLNP